MKTLKSLNSDNLGEVLLLGGGVILIGLTLHLYPSFDPSRAASARSRFSPGEASRQIDSAKAYLNAHPDDMNTHTALAMAYYQKGPDHYVEAMNALEKARSLGATNDALFFYAGVMYETLGLPDYAINELTKYLRHHPNDYETMLRLANAHFQKKDYDEAQTLYKQALHIYPKDATAWFNYAIVSKEKGNYVQALHCLEQVIRLAGRLPEGGLYQQGEIYRLKGDAAQALDAYQKELASAPDYLPALIALEVIKRAGGDIKESRLLRKRISELKKRNVPIAAPPPAVVASPVAKVSPVPATVPPPAVTPAPTTIPAQAPVSAPATPVDVANPVDSPSTSAVTNP